MSVSIMLSGNGELDSRRIAEISSRTEKNGFDGLWFGETTLRDASVLTAVAAQATEKIQLGTSIVNVFTRAPGQLARLGATLNELSNGRFTLGLGVSTEVVVQNWHGQSFDKPVPRIEETVALLRQYFSGERFSRQGQFYSPVNARLRLSSAPKIALAALNDRMIRKAGALADRVILNLYPTERIVHAIQLVDAGLRDAGKKDRPTVSVMLYAHVLGDDEKGMQAARDLVAFYASAPAYSRLFASIGYAEQARVMMEAWKAKDRESVKRAITRDMVDSVMVLGTIRELRERVKLYHEQGVEDVLISPSPSASFEGNVSEVLEHYH